MRNHLPKKCNELQNFKNATSDEKIKLNDVEFKLIENKLEQRISYSIPWQLKIGQTYPKILWKGEENVPILTIKQLSIYTQQPSGEFVGGFQSTQLDVNSSISPFFVFMIFECSNQ